MNSIRCHSWNCVYNIWFISQRVINMGTFPLFCFSKVGVRCISRPPNYVSKIWGQILGLYTGIYGIWSVEAKTSAKRHRLLAFCWLRGCLHDTGSRFNPKGARSCFSIPPQVTSVFERTVFTWLRNESEVIPDPVRTGVHVPDRNFYSRVDPIPESYKRRSNLIPERDRLTSRSAHA